MPIFLRPELSAPRHTATAVCPNCRAAADPAWGSTATAARVAALAKLQRACECPLPQKFLLDSTPDGFALFLDGLGGLRRLHLHGGRLYGPYGELAPGGLPLLLVTDDRPPPDTGENRLLRRAWLRGVAKVADRFRKKGFWVQVCHGAAANRVDDPLGPIAPAPRRRKKKAVAP